MRALLQTRSEHFRISQLQIIQIGTSQIGTLFTKYQKKRSNIDAIRII